jgi:Fic family protein
MKIHSLIIEPEYLKHIADLDAFQASWDARHALTPERLSALRHVATIESIGSSTRIEGSRLSDAEVEQVLGRLEQQSFETRDEQEIAGYADAMDTIFTNYAEIPFTENYLKQLHKILLNYSEKDTRHRGKYKTLNNNVEAFDPDGKSLGVVFKTTTPFDTPREMEALVRWTRESLDDKSLHPILVIGVFNVVFLAIHPFQDGNGRLSRVLATLLLLRSGYHYVPYSSLESIIERSKDRYYLALRRTQGTLEREDPDWQPWLTFFLRSLAAQKKHLDTKLTASQGWDALPLDSIAILNYLSIHDRLTVSEAETLTKTPRSTLKLRLKHLSDQGLIKRHGKARGTWYVLG